MATGKNFCPYCGAECDFTGRNPNGPRFCSVCSRELPPGERHSGLDGTFNRSSRPRLSDLRNQATIVAGELPSGDAASPPPPSSPSSAQDGLPLPFQVGKFRAEKLLARGGMSITYLGVSTELPERRVVIKIPDGHSGKTIAMFRSECRILGTLSHPGIVPILAAGDLPAAAGGVPYMVMKFIDGQSLRQRLNTRGKLSWEEAAQLLEDVATALEYLRSHRICHRDIKPDNIIFDSETHHWVLVDFGIAKSLQDNWRMTMTMAGRDSGTWDYMPPEQLEGKAVDIRCDIYALGTVVWEALIGKIPRRGTKLPSAFGLKLPPDVDLLIEKMVEHDPENRYQTPAELLHALHAGAKRVEQWKKTGKRIRTALRLGGALLVILLLLGGGWLIGDFIAAARIRSLQENHRESATITLREVNAFLGEQPLFFGRRYFASIRPELEKKAAQEQERMRGEFLEIRDRLKKTGEGVDELRAQLILCDNFIAKWRGTFNGAELREIERSRAALQQKIVRLEENTLVEETVSAAKKRAAAGSIAAYREAIEQCRRTDGLLRLAESRKKLGDTVSGLKRDAAAAAVRQADLLLRNDSRKEWFVADALLRETLAFTGEEPVLTAGLRRIDDRLWGYVQEKTKQFIDNRQFADAESCLALYERSGMKTHLDDWNEAKLQIAQARENFDWEETQKLVRAYWNDRAFPASLTALERFIQAYPGRRSDEVDVLRREIAGRYADWIVAQWEDLESYLENLRCFLEKFPQETEKIRTLRRGLCRSIHREIGSIVSESAADSRGRSERLGEIRFDLCEKDQQKYLERLIAAAQEYLQIVSGDDEEQSIWTIFSNRSEELHEAEMKFQYEFQRPPENCVPGGTPTVFRVAIAKIKVNLSDAHFKETNAMWRGCNLVVQIGPAGKKPWKLLSRPDDDKQTFEFSDRVEFWWDTEAQDFAVQIAEKRLFGLANPHEKTIPADSFRKSGSAALELDNGTTVEISWNSR